MVGWFDRGDYSVAFVRAHDGNGDELFTQSHRHGQSDFFSGVAVAEDGSMTAAGATYSEDGGWDIWVVGLDRDGEVQWEDVVGADGEDQAVGVTPGPAVAGYEMQGDGTTDAWVRRYNPSGETEWTHTYDGAAGGIDVATEIATDGAGVVVIGYETNAEGDTDVWLQELDASGGVAWSSGYAGAARGDDRGAAIAVDGRGAIAVGSSTVSGRTIDAWIGRFDGAGDLGWFDEHDGPASLGDAATDVAIGPSGSLAVAGYEFVDGEKWDGCVRLLSENGDTVWMDRFRGDAHEDDIASSISFGPQGDVYVAGSTIAGSETPSIWVRRIAEGTASE